MAPHNTLVWSLLNLGGFALLAAIVRMGHIDWLRSEPGVPLFLYTELTPPSARALLVFGPSGIRGLIFYGHDDTPKRLVETLDAALSSSVGTQP